MSKDDTSKTITLSFEKPVPVLGLHAQHLGYVRRCRMTAQACMIDALELQTRWQNIEIARSAVSYDAKEGVFRLIKGDALVYKVN